MGGGGGGWVRRRRQRAYTRSLNGGFVVRDSPARRALFEIYLPWLLANHHIEINAVLEAADDIYTRATDPFNPRRVAAILKKVQIGPDVSSAERAVVLEFLAEFADVFALSVGEVNAVADAVYAPKIPDDAVFNTGVVHQRPWTLPQNLDANAQVDVLIAAGVLRRIDAQDVRCVSPISLAEKVH
ncbi:hypothetical protein C8R46DRAFT_925259, partial [Mycena filopes]